MITVDRALEIADALHEQDKPKLHAFCADGWSGSVDDVLQVLVAEVRAVRPRRLNLVPARNPEITS